MKLPRFARQTDATKEQPRSLINAQLSQSAVDPLHAAVPKFHTIYSHLFYNQGLLRRINTMAQRHSPFNETLE